MGCPLIDCFNSSFCWCIKCLDNLKFLKIRSVEGGGGIYTNSIVIVPTVDVLIQRKEYAPVVVDLC